MRFGRKILRWTATFAILDSGVIARRTGMSTAGMAFSTSMSMSAARDRHHLVLVGGGHAHVQVIKALNKASRPSNLDVTLIDVQQSASYSGMVPGTVSGLYTPEDTLLHLAPLAKWAGIDFIHQKVVDIDIDSKFIHFQDDNEKPVPFDVVSLDIGSTSRGLHETKGAQEFTIPTRPIAKLVQRIEEESKLLKNNPRCIHVVVIGGGAAGTELSMSIRGRWGGILGDKKVSVTVLDSGDRLLPSESDANRNALVNTLKEHNIEVRHQCTVEEVMEGSLRLTSGEILDFTHCLWATGAGAHSLAQTLGDRGLPISKHGWIQVNEFLQSVSHPSIFAAGDCCTVEGLKNGSPPKAGVYAVRSGPILIENLTRAFDEKKKNDLKAYKPQDDFLKLMVCGDGKAIGFRFGIPFKGKWVMDLKNEIDTGFMDLFKVDNLPELEEGQSYDVSQYDDDSGRKRPEALPAADAAVLLQRTDDDVDFEVAWSIIRRMNSDEEYRQEVLDNVSANLPVFS